MTVAAEYKKSKGKEKTQPRKRRMAPNAVITQSPEEPHSHVMHTSHEGGSAVQTNLPEPTIPSAQHRAGTASTSRQE